MSTDPNPFPQPQKLASPLSDEDFIMLESLVKSPAFTVLRKVIALYKAEATGVLETESDTHKMFQAQGRIAGAKAIENCTLLVQQWKKNQQTKARAAEELEKRDKRLRSQEKRPPIR